jgi:PAS domain S-box-containing protein
MPALSLGAASMIEQALSPTAAGVRLWAYGAAELLTGISYLVISVALVVLLWRGRRNMPFVNTAIAFGAFVVLSGATSIAYAFARIRPVGGVELALIGGTSLAAAIVAIRLPRIVPLLLRMFQATRDEADRRAEIDRIFMISHDLMCILGTDGRFTRVNPAFERILGYTANEMLAVNPLELIHEDDREHAIAAQAQLSAHVVNVSFEVRCRTKAGRYRTFSWSASSDPERGLIFASARDVSDERSAEERFRNAFHQSGIGYALVGVDGRFVQVNRKLCEIVGYSEARLLERTLHELTHPDDRELGDEQIARLLRGEIDSYQMEKRYLRPDGSEVWTLLTASPVHDDAGRPLALLKQVQDISARKSAEAILERQAEELQRSNAELEQFAYVASHDLQEPLRMVASYTQMLAKRYRGRLDADADEFIGYAVDGATRMQRLIEDLLTFSRVGTRGKALTPVAASDALDRAVLNLRHMIESTGAVIVHGELPIVCADDVQLTQLFQNLLANAIKFRTDATPRVEISAMQNESGQWTFAVSDNGIGIEPQYFDKIFAMFRRLHAAHEYPGSGIGLAICKKIVERHGGRISVASSPGAGATFSFTIPRFDS